MSPDVSYIWQRADWPKIYFDGNALLQPLGRARKAQGHLAAEGRHLNLELQADILSEDAITTSAIEGENLNRDSVRSSVARRLGLPTAGLPQSDRRVDGLVEMLLDATRNFSHPLTTERLKSWQAALFPSGYSGMSKIRVGDWRTSTEPMRVVSGPLGRETIHFEAPPSERVPEEIDKFIQWFNSASWEMDGIIRAAVAHLWFVTIHPFEDGNGRISRAIADMALAQDEQTGLRLYSVSAQINADRDEYYDILERTQKGDGDITNWVVWFLGCIERSMDRAASMFTTANMKAAFWQCLNVNERQRKVLNRLFDAGRDGFIGGLTNHKYRSMTGTTPETAYSGETRHPFWSQTRHPFWSQTHHLLRIRASRHRVTNPLQHIEPHALFPQGPIKPKAPSHLAR